MMGSVAVLSLDREGVGSLLGRGLIRRSKGVCG